MKDGIKVIKSWQVAVLVAILLGGIGAAYGAYAVLNGSGETALNGDQQVIPVTRGDLINDISINGSVAYPNRETLSFGTPGIVGELLVEEDQAVIAGQPLATMDSESIATLEQTLALAQTHLRDAEEALDSANNPYTVLDIARAESKVADARTSFRTCRMRWASC